MRSLGRRISRTKSLQILASGLAVALALAACGASDAPTDDPSATDSGSQSVETPGESGDAEPGADPSSPADDGDEENSDDAVELSDAELTLALLSDPNFLDPQLTSTNAVQIPAQEIFEGLYAQDGQLKPQLMLADDVDVSDDGTRYTFALRDVAFQNGAPLTADDVVATMERAMSLPENPMAQVASLLESLVADDASHVTFTFSQPVGALPDLLASQQSVILPAASLDGAGVEPIPGEKIIGTGPYQLSDWQPGQYLLLSRYDGYKPVDSASSGLAGKKTAAAATLRFVPVSDPGARLAGLQTGQYQWADQMTPDLYDSLSSDPSVQVNLTPAGFTALYFNHKSGPMTDPKLRHAVQIVIDHDEVALTQGPDVTWEITPELPTSTVEYASTAGTDEFDQRDLELAKQLVSESSYNGEELVIISTAGSPTGKAMVVVAEQLQELGLNVKLSEMDLVTGQKARQQETGWAMAGGLEGGTAANATQLPDLQCGNGQGGYCSDEMNGLLAKFAGALTDSDRQAIHDDIQTLYYSDVVSIKLVENYRIILTSSDVSGYESFGYPHFWNVAYN